MYNLFPFDLPLSSLLGYNLEVIPNKSELGITDPSYDLMGRYGEPSENFSIYGPYWSALQAWEMWLHKPEPIIAILDTRLSSLIPDKPSSKKEYNSLLDIVNKFKL
jgi:hypothetical protein